MPFIQVREINDERGFPIRARSDDRTDNITLAQERVSRGGEARVCQLQEAAHYRQDKNIRRNRPRGAHHLQRRDGWYPTYRPLYRPMHEGRVEYLYRQPRTEIGMQQMNNRRWLPQSPVTDVQNEKLDKETEDMELLDILEKLEKHWDADNQSSEKEYYTYRDSTTPMPSSLSDDTSIVDYRSEEYEDLTNTSDAESRTEKYIGKKKQLKKHKSDTTSREYDSSEDEAYLNAGSVVRVMPCVSPIYNVNGEMQCSRKSCTSSEGDELDLCVQGHNILTGTYDHQTRRDAASPDDDRAVVADVKQQLNNDIRPNEYVEELTLPLESTIKMEEKIPEVKNMAWDKNLTKQSEPRRFLPSTCSAKVQAIHIVASPHDDEQIPHDVNDMPFDTEKKALDKALSPSDRDNAKKYTNTEIPETSEAWTIPKTGATTGIRMLMEKRKQRTTKVKQINITEENDKKKTGFAKIVRGCRRFFGRLKLVFVCGAAN